ncbi:hypothetical protein [Pantoea sp. GbtcB22]|uniref:hypothetical protein n=1 Tax=Pantoea sp. GbtcB22 TaxID=2824767 RepID=UPI001C303252|nr:hypothetical protein [Pantoea sp. GbtcB22]
MAKITISRVEISLKFASTSDTFGFDQDVVDSYEDDILDLQELWEQQGYIEVFDPIAHSRIKYGMVKPSISDPGASPAYDDLYHSRVLRDENDPLLIITFKGEIIPQKEYEKAVILAMIDHDLMFMPKGRKAQYLKAQQRKFVRHVIDKNEN